MNGHVQNTDKSLVEANKLLFCRGILAVAFNVMQDDGRAAGKSDGTGDGSA